MPYKNKEEALASGRRSYQKNKEKRKEKNKTYYEKNPQVYVISNWIRQGIVDIDFKAVYDVFIMQTNCWICDRVYEEKNRRSLDHDHDTGEIRYICCNSCNVKIVG